MKIIFNLITFLLCTGIVFAQQTITGKVTDAKNNPIEGANIYLEGTYDGASSDANGNATEGDVVVIDTKDCFIDNRADGPVVTLGVSDLIIVRSGDAILVAKRGEAERVKEIVQRLEADGRSEYL